MGRGKGEGGLKGEIVECGWCGVWCCGVVYFAQRDVRGSVVVRLSVVLRHSANVSHLTQALTRYQMLFRHLFYSKHVERQLCKCGLDFLVVDVIFIKAVFIII